MELIVLKGFGKNEIASIGISSLLDKPLENRINILNFDDEYYRSLIRALTTMDENKYIIYEEFALMCSKDNGITLNNMLTSFGHKLKVLYNNIYPEIYPCNFENYDLLDKYITEVETNFKEPSDELAIVHQIYNKIYYISGKYYVSFNNYEFDMTDYIKEDKYSSEPKPVQKGLETEFLYEISEDEQEYIEKINSIQQSGYKNIGIRLMGKTSRVMDLYKSFCAFINTGDYELTEYKKSEYREDLIKDFKEIVNTVLKVPDFKDFKDLDFYENPSVNNTMIKINQTQIMSDMVEQAQNARNCEKLVIESEGKKFSSYRDIFVTAPTGAGKSLIFQIPAIYLAQKEGLLTIIITPLIELMNDQVRNLHERGYQAAERLNSSINPIEKSNIVKKISEGKINLLYLAPETLLSYSIDQLIGDRKIGLVIIDEAHIVSTWGKGFRPDYWYLGSYLDKLRKLRNSKGLHDKSKAIYCFPICTFTATAVNGGKYDDVSDIKNSLNLRDTITYYGKVIRDNIKFDIINFTSWKTKNLDEYQKVKNAALKERIKFFLDNDEKTIVYFPWASTAYEAYNADGIHQFDNLEEYKSNFAIYTGGNSFSSDAKIENMMDFRDGRKKIMFATKAFGMGIDIKDIENVYHYAVSGNLNDYVQEIGRVARSKDIPYGFASTDYFDRDLNYMKTLYGMSALQHFQVQKILSIILNIYDSKKKYNLMVTPDMFKPVFPKCSDDELEAKIKSALLTIEKDLDSRYKGSKPIVTRARNMFTECFAMVNSMNEENLLQSKYGKYFKKIKKGKSGEIDIRYYGDVRTTEYGDIFKIDLKSLWEELHSNKTFGEFKYKLNSTPFEIFEQYCSSIKLRNKVTIKMLDDKPLKDLSSRLFEEINIVSTVLNEMQLDGGFFSRKEFADKLEAVYKNKFKAKIVANTYLDMLSEFKDDFVQNFFETKTINDEIKYRIVRGTFRSIAEKAVTTSPLLRAVRLIESSEYVTYDPLSLRGNSKRDNRYDAINLALLFGLVSFEIIGGDKPEIFIRINYPEKIRQIVNGKVNYINSLVEQAKMRHENDIVILNAFFTKFETDDERWKFIENYYLGKVTSNENNELVIEN